MVDLNKLREALSFGARTDDPKLMATVYRTELEGLKREVFECDNGPKVISRKCIRCSAEFSVTDRHAAQIPEDSFFNTCDCCFDKLTSKSEISEISPADQQWLNTLFGEVRGNQSDQ